MLKNINDLFILHYAEALDLADRVYLTRVHRHVEGDAYFPILENAAWHEIAREDVAAKEPNPFDFSYQVLDRIKASTSNQYP